jgi:hypothetical protein
MEIFGRRERLPHVEVKFARAGKAYLILSRTAALSASLSSR